jgi:hypothetical protein
VSAAHTPEPWFVVEQNAGSQGTQVWARGGDTRVANCDSASISLEGRRADARRIKACVNACKGVPIEVLEASKADGMPWNVADQVMNRVERGKLLAALRLMHDVMTRMSHEEHERPTEEECDSAITVAAAAMAEANLPDVERLPADDTEGGAA